MRIMLAHAQGGIYKMESQVHENTPELQEFLRGIISQITNTEITVQKTLADILGIEEED